MFIVDLQLMFIQVRLLLDDTFCTTGCMRLEGRESLVGDFRPGLVLLTTATTFARRGLVRLQVIAIFCDLCICFAEQLSATVSLATAVEFMNGTAKRGLLRAFADRSNLRRFFPSFIGKLLGEAFLAAFKGSAFSLAGSSMAGRFLAMSMEYT
jgi:hypothetical protein